MKQLKLLLLSSMIVFFTACGGGGGSSSSAVVAPLNPATPTVTSLEVTSNYSSAITGTSVQLFARASYSDGKIEDVTQQVKWSSGDETIATINSEGLVSAVREGDVALYAEYENKSSLENIHVVESDIVSIELSVPSKIPNNAKVGIGVIGLQSDGTQIDITRLSSISVLDTSVAYYSEQPEHQVYKRLITTSLGTTGINAVYHNLSAEINFTVVNPTFISGQITTDTVWSEEDSPYVLTDMIQIANGVTVSIQAGSQLYNANKHAINVFGDLNAEGMESSNIYFNCINISPSNNSNTGTSNPGKVNIDFAKMYSGAIYDSAPNAILNIQNSVLDGDFYINHNWSHVDAVWHMEKNIFLINSGMNLRPTGDEDIYITNNLFMDSSKINVSSGHNDVNGIILNYNSFMNTNNEVLVMDNMWGAVKSAEYNYWGTSDENVIESMIHDSTDDLSIVSKVDFEPFLTEPDPDTPIYNP